VIAAGETDMIALLTEEPLSLDALTALVHDDGCGAVASFLAVVCNTRPGRRVLRVEYRIPSEPAEAAMAAVAAEIRGRWGIERVALARRSGRLGLGDAVLAVAVAARHRAEALAACAFAIDGVKQRVPVWKREEWDDGACSEGWEVEPPATAAPGTDVSPAWRSAR